MGLFHSDVVFQIEDGIYNRDHPRPDCVGLHSGHRDHHVLLLRGTTEEGED